MTAIDSSAFEAKVTGEGYQVFHRTLDPDAELDLHAHDYDVWGLVQTGECRITVKGTTECYGAGQEFRLTANCIHSECAGPHGVTFVVGRRTK